MSSPKGCSSKQTSAPSIAFKENENYVCTSSVLNSKFIGCAVIGTIIAVATGALIGYGIHSDGLTPLTMGAGIGLGFALFCIWGAKKWKENSHVWFPPKIEITDDELVGVNIPKKTTAQRNGAVAARQRRGECPTLD